MQILNQPSPKDTIALMQKMLEAGMLSDHMVRKIHHRGRGIIRHLKYLFEHDSYQPNSPNIAFHNQLNCLYAEFREMSK